MYQNKKMNITNFLNKILKADSKRIHLDVVTIELLD